MILEIIRFYVYGLLTKLFIWRTSPTYSKAVLHELIERSNPTTVTEFWKTFKAFCSVTFQHDLYGDALLIQWDHDEDGTFSIDFTRQFQYNSFIINEHMDQCSLTLSLKNSSELQTVENGNIWSFRKDNTTKPINEFFSQIEEMSHFKIMLSQNEVESHEVTYSKLYSSWVVLWENTASP